jgi:hypothetical protein
MGLEAATFIHQLNAAWPTGAADPKSQGDDHLRLLKSTLQATFPNVTGAVTATHTALNTMALGTANPTGTVGLAAVNGVATSVMRSDGAPALSQAIAPTWSGAHKFTNANAIEIESAAPLLIIDETDAAANERSWLINTVGGIFSVSTATDAAPTVPVANAFFADRIGTALGTITFPGDPATGPGISINASGGGTDSGLQLNCALPSVNLFQNTGAADNKSWDFSVSAEQLRGRTINDANSVAYSRPNGHGCRQYHAHGNRRRDSRADYFYCRQSSHLDSIPWVDFQRDRRGSQ